MSTPFPDERSLREAINRLRAVYDRARHQLTSPTSHAPQGAREAPSAAGFSRVLTEINGAESALRQLVEVWSRCQTSLRRRLAEDVEALRSSAATCLALVSTTEREYGLQREQVVRQLDEGVTRNRAVRAYSHAMRQ